MIRFRFTATVLALGLTLACAFSLRADSARAEGADATAHVYFLRGFMGVFSFGLDAMAQKVRARDLQATVHHHAEWGAIADAAVRDYRAGRTRAVLFVGHSLGAGAAIQAAEQLAAAGVPVKLIVTLDPVARISSPRNVERMVNMYFPNGMGEPVARGENFKGSLDNIKLPENQEFGHFSMDKVPLIQQQVLGHVFAASAPPLRRRSHH